MAGSRVHKLGSIYERITGLLQSGALKEYEKPVWYDVYTRYPPKYDPRFDRKAPEIEVKPIFYEEDFIRAEIHKAIDIGYFDLEKRKSKTEGLIKKCRSIMDRKGVSSTEAIKMLSNDSKQTEGESLPGSTNVTLSNST